ncbi:MAG: hypothetical protein R2817_06955 [Flavobacteriales bacterium]
MSTRITGIFMALFLPLALLAQTGDQQLRAKADALFKERRFAEAMTMYSQLVSLEPADRELNYRFGTCLLHSGDDREKAIGHLKYATEDPAGPSAAWYWLGRAYHLNYRFKEAQTAYQRFRGTGDRKALEEWPVEGLEQQCRNGEKLLSSLKDVRVRSKVESAETEFFRYYELGDIGGRIVVTPEELRTSLDKKSGQRGLIYLPDRKGPIYFSSLGKDGRTGRDIYRTELMPDGTFAAPIKLAGYINTDLDEDFPFLHPDGKSFYFSSKGHNSMGGYDVFRATYDKGIDAFGRPENLDFAVNTPDDDIFYVVDGEHKEACFASGRSSAQGRLHVYRVSTAQVPVVITVLKGTFANQFDKNDRKARIVVEDALTRETVADVRTDINGSYVLSLPRSGRFRFLVECGPGGRTHAGMVEVPASASPRAYRQELDLEDQAGQERLVIRNYFDEPLGDDIVALALDEIKRRARLDVSTGSDPLLPTEGPAPVADVLTAAGFTGDVDKAAAQRIADEDALAYEQEAAELERASKEALAIAVASLDEAAEATREAGQLIQEAAGIADESVRNGRMTEAARSRQRAREAGMRARAAQRTAEDLARDALTQRQRAIEADRIATSIRATLGAGKEQEALPHLVALRTQHEARTGPNAEANAAERARRAVTAQREQAERALRQATSMREEENELTDRVNRLKREQESTGNKSRKAELQRSIEELDGQLLALRDETRAAQAKALALERESSVLRGQAALTAMLEGATGAMPPTVSEEVAATLPQRILETEQRANELPIDERFEALLNEPVAQMEARIFNWEIHAPTRGGLIAAAPTATLARGTDRSEDTATPTRSMGGVAQPATQVAGTQDGRGAGDGASAQREVSGGTASAVGTDRSVDTGTVDAAQGDPARTASDGPPQRSAEVAPQDRVIEASGTGDGTRSANVTQRSSDPSTAAAGERAGGDAAAGATDQRSTEQRSGEDAARVADATGSDGRTGADGALVSGAVDQRASEGAGQEIEPPVAANEGGTERSSSGGSTTEAPAAMEQRFLLENERAELAQALPSIRDRAERTRIEQRLSAIDGALNELTTQEDRATEQAEERALPAPSFDPTRVPLVFTAATPDERIIDSLFADHKALRERLYRLPDADERAEALHGLELMIADSIREEMAVQLAVVELDPQQASVVLPRVERLRQLREGSRAQAERHLSERREQIAAAEREATGSETSDEAALAVAAAMLPPGEDPIRDRFVSIDPSRVFHSRVEHRSEEVREVSAEKDRDLARLDDLSQRIDSLNDRMLGMARDKEYQRLEKQRDRFLDERYILSTELGQRSAFLTRSEWDLALDSLKTIGRTVAAKGLASDEPLVLMAQGTRADAERDFRAAGELRKRADRSEEIVLRDTLYRQAYQLELEALRNMDRTLTVQNYLAGDRFISGEALAYEVVASRVLGLEERELIAAADRAATRTAQAPEASASPDATLVRAEEIRDAGSTTGTASDVADAERPRATEQQDLSQDVAAGSTVSGRQQEPASVAGESRAQQEGLRPDPLATTRTQEGQDTGRRALIDGATEIERAEARLRPEDRIPPGMYEEYLRSDLSALPEGGVDAADPSALSLRIEALKQESASLQRQADERAASAQAMTASASEARKRERTRLENLALREQRSADSLREASDLRTAEVDRLSADLLVAEQQQEWRQRVMKFYYLTPEDQKIAFSNTDESRYFQMRALALEQGDAAAEADRAAKGNRDVAGLMRTSALEARRRAGDEPDEATLEQISRLEMRASSLLQRADSLDQVAVRLRSAADLNMQQASVLLQGMDASRSSELQALETSSRRSDALLANMRDAQPRGGTTEAGGAGTDLQDSVRDTTRDGADPRTASTASTNGTPASVAVQAAPPTAPTSVPSTVATADPALRAARLPEELVSDLFELQPAGVVRTEPILMDAPMPEGIVFKVQIGAFRRPVSEEAFSDMTPVMGETVGNGLVRYTAGLFTGFRQAAEAKDKVRGRGYTDAFVVAYRDGRRIPLGEAMRAVAAEQRAATAAASPTAQNTSSAGTPASTATTTPAANTTVNASVPPVASVPAAPAPVVIQSAAGTAPADDASVLARYPASVDEVLSTFAPPADATAYYNVPGAAPATQVETVRGLFYTVQVGVYSRPVALDKLFNITPLNSERTETAKVRYTTGIYTDMDSVRRRREEAVALGVKDAFITAYLNGRRISMREAALLIGKFGPDILAKP